MDADDDRASNPNERLLRQGANRRHHCHDAAGELLRRGGWEELRLTTLRQLKHDIGSYVVGAQFRQNPVPAHGISSSASGANATE